MRFAGVPQGSVTSLQLDCRTIATHDGGIAFDQHEQLFARRGMESNRSTSLQPKGMDLGSATDKTNGESDAAKTLFDSGGDVGQVNNLH